MITKPLTWAVHVEKENVVPIFSVDISPRGNCFATGGEDGVVKIWSFARALASTSSETIHIADIKVHDKPVNSVRFNCTGRLLASGGSDGVVSVAAWIPNGDPLWQTCRKWHQQKLDVSEVAWGTNERRHLLASCSFDGTIVIWDVERGQSSHIITGHQNMVKGIAWDPLGQFLASQADAEGVFIWRTSDWKCIKRISEPFKEAVDASDHLRLSWSPNGMYLTGVQAHALPQPYVAVLKRDRWNLEFCVVGHRSGVSISKWNPRFFHPRGQTADPDADPEKLAMCLCLGSLDRTFSLWLQTEDHPILHMDGFFENRISDIAWSADGYTCLVASRDGFVALCNFTEQDLGIAASYQVSPKDVFPSSSKMPVAENMQLWMLEQGKDVPPPALPEPQDKRERIWATQENHVVEQQSKRLKKVTSVEPLLSRMALTAPVLPPPSTPIKSVKPRRPSGESPSSREKRGIRTSFVQPCGKKQAPDGTWINLQLLVENGVGDQRCSLICSEGEREIWRDELRSRVLTATGNAHFIAVSTDRAAIQVYDEVGMALLPSLQLPSSVSNLISDETWHLMSLTNCGEISLWNFQQRRLVCRASVCSLCKQSQRSRAPRSSLVLRVFVCTVSTVQFSPNALPVVVLSDGQSFLYNTTLEAWTLYSDTNRPPTVHHTLQSCAEDEMEVTVESLSLHAHDTDVKHELEQGVLNAMELQSPQLYRQWLLSYVRCLISGIARGGSSVQEDEAKLRKICIDLFQGRQTELLEMTPVQFVRCQILPEMAKVRDLQRLVEEILDWIQRL